VNHPAGQAAETLTEPRPELGAIVGRFDRLPWYRNSLILWTLVAAVIFVGGAYLKRQKGKDVSIVEVCFWGGAGLIAVTAAFVLTKKRTIELFEAGLRDCEQGKLTFDCLWSEVVSLMEHRKSPGDDGFFGLKLYKADGTSCGISDNVERFKEIRNAITAEVYSLKIPEAIAMIECDEWLEFGALKVGRDGVQAEGEVVPWSEVDVTYEQYDMVLRRMPGKRKLWRNAVETVPNFSVLLTLLRRYGVDG
jgi:hypothetical protein